MSTHDEDDALDTFSGKLAAELRNATAEGDRHKKIRQQAREELRKLFRDLNTDNQTVGFGIAFQLYDDKDRHELAVTHNSVRLLSWSIDENIPGMLKLNATPPPGVSPSGAANAEAAAALTAKLLARYMITGSMWPRAA